MARLQLWNRTKKNDYKFFDRTIREMFDIGGTEFLIHKFVGSAPQNIDPDAPVDATEPTYPEDAAITIQDLLLLEIRDRIYDDSVYSLMGSYNVQDNDFDLTQFGIFLSNDTLYISFHINEMINRMGRKLIPGDVLELPHLRDDSILDGSDDGISDKPAIPKLYKVEDANRSSEGFSPTWFPHIWRVKISPLTDSQEYRDLLERDLSEFNDGYPGNFDGSGDEGITLGDASSTKVIEIAISDAILEQAETDVPNRNLEHQHLWVDEDKESGLPFLFMTDGIPPNGQPLLGQGAEFPALPSNGSWFLRTDFTPDVLFKREESKWTRKEIDYREVWTTANRTLNKFINNRNTVSTNAGDIDSRVPVSKIIVSKDRPGPDEVS
jgi:hypothetical protein